MVPYKPFAIVSAAFLLAVHPSIAQSLPNCKVTPSSPDWPSKADWNSLNESVSGRLIAPVPAGAVCHPGRPEFSNQSCALLAEQWTNESYHALQPASVDYNDVTCLPSANTTCSADGYPAYVIAAVNEADVQEGVKFAARTGVRLIVKGTGHDYPGRSSGPGSLSIWTHNIRGIEITPQKDTDTDAIGTAKIAAGMRVKEILDAATEKNVTIVTGADPGVGIGGWISGGGHGPITSRYGLGADQALAMEVVTADGQFLSIDPDHYPDLFWAMRGGGGSTFGVLISVTVRVYPAISLTTTIYAINTTANSDSFWSALTTFHSQIPKLSEAGAMGYYYAWPEHDTEPNPLLRGQILGIFLFPGQSPAYADRILSPLFSLINTTSNVSDPIYTNSLTTPNPAFSPRWAVTPGEIVGVAGRLGSRLLDAKALTSNLPKLNTALRTSTTAPWLLIGHLVAGPGPRNVRIPGGGNAILPAWRRTYSHLATLRTWTAGNATQENALTSELRNVGVQALRDLAPDTGAYMSEADPTEPDFQHAFWGENYARLKALKDKWDPKGVFWCANCVGAEEWVVTGGDAVGQHAGKICRK